MTSSTSHSYIYQIFMVAIYGVRKSSLKEKHTKKDFDDNLLKLFSRHHRKWVSCPIKD